MELIKAEKLSKHFKDTRVFDDLDFSVHSGEMVALMGAAGSGKSTLLRLIGVKYNLKLILRSRKHVDKDRPGPLALKTV